MSLITQCPACTTMFRVVSDQLRVSDGWVRCGQCDEVFDASAHLQSDVIDVESAADSATSPNEELTDPAETTEFSPLVPEASVQEQSVAPKPEADIDPALQNQSATAIGAPALALRGSEPVHADSFLEKSPKELSRFQEFNAVLSAEHARLLSDQALQALPDAAGQATPRYRQSDSPSISASTDALPSFLRHPSAPSVWQRPLVRSLLALACLVLSGVLVLQLAVQERDRLAAHVPSTQPWLESVCTLFACEVAALRQIEAIVIDSSSFSKDRPDTYRLNFTLKNTAAVDVAIPSLELTLTDLREESLVRRVFGPEELGIRQKRFASGTELSASLPIGIRIAGTADRITGYRLLAFYP
ncbi:MAG: DUF3426 domain-containing protein [Rhodoferax sp.]|nr:DUF3426 domain-containing protein [Rhodoferax sp.]MCF8210636.1 DUF3426 domain-containing protein [Rhodoferax sp.]